MEYINTYEIPVWVNFCSNFEKYIYYFSRTVPLHPTLPYSALILLRQDLLVRLITLHKIC